MLDDTAINNAQTKTENKILQEQIYSKQNTISRLNNMIVEKNEEIEKLKKVEVFTLFGCVFTFLIGMYVSYKINNKN